MVVDVRDKCALSNEVRLEMLKYYPNARLAYFKVVLLFARFLC